MNKESLEELKKIIMSGLNKSKIDELDKTELMLNMSILLKSKENYENGIKILKLNNRGFKK